MFYKVEANQETVSIVLSGDFIQADVAVETQRLISAIQAYRANSILFQNKGIHKWDTSFLAIIYALILHFKSQKFDTSELPADLRQLITLAMADHRLPTHSEEKKGPFLERLGASVLSAFTSFKRGLSFIQDVLASIHRWIKRKATFRSVDFWRALDDCAPKAVGIVSLISLMVGLILAFVGAIQLKAFGAEIYVASLVTIGMTRIMGAIMIGVIMAGRTGASYAASLGTMQVNEELDALKTMGISRTDFLILPRLGALVFAMPFLVILSDFMGMLGGGLVGVMMLGISPESYWTYSVEAFNLQNFNIGIFHGIVYGVIIALCGCYFGIHCGRNSGSVGIATTRAVVYGIVWMIVMTGVLTLICEVLGI